MANARYAYNIGGYRIDESPTLGGATAIFGTPNSRQALPRSQACVVRWANAGLKITFVQYAPGGGSACEDDVGVPEVAVMTGPGHWRTSRRLTIGHSLARLRVLYPGATRHGAVWWLMSAYFPFAKRRMASLSALVSEGRVYGFRGFIGT